jgi:nitrate reductase alpha subunit
MDHANLTTRRRFLHLMGAGGLMAMTPLDLLGGLAPVVDVTNPLEFYPSRDWERIYRDQYRYDRSFAWVCAPNCTHNCRLRAFVRNGVAVRLEQNYDNQRIGDLDGNTASHAWNPRGCNKGFTMQRRVYGPSRLRAPLIRKGWKQWADDGFPPLSDDPSLRDKYKFNARGSDTFLRLPWEEIYRYHAKAAIAIARTYSGPEGEARPRRTATSPR